MLNFDTMYGNNNMRNRKLKKLLNLWQKNELISQVQAENILKFMKERQKETFFRLLKWLMILGAFWLVFGLIATIINLLEIDFFHKIFVKIGEIFVYLGQFVYTWLLLPIHDYIIHPVCSFIEKIFKNERHFFYYGTYSLIVSLVGMYISSKIKPNKDIDNLNLSDEQKNVLKTNWVLDIISSVFLAGTFCFYNMLLLPAGDIYANEKVIPLWNILGAVVFVALAYKFRKNLFLVFGIYFVSLSVGMFSGYDFACYWIGVSRPVLQIAVAVILLLLGYVTQLKIQIKDSQNDDNTYIQEKFAGTYNWTGLLMLFIALWITSIWGFDFDLGKSDGYAVEIWFANILFIATSIGALFYGVKTEQKIFFNYGLVFLIIETYTVFCGRLWENLPSGVASLILGALLIGTGKILQKVYLKKQIKSEE